MNIDYWEPSQAHFKPIRVTAKLTEPVVYAGDLLHLDGMIAWATYHELDDRTRRRIPPLSSDWVVDIQLPMGQWRTDVGASWQGDPRLLWKYPGNRGRAGKTTMLWGWRASCECQPWAAHGSTEIRKRPPLDEMRRFSDDHSATISAGPMKGYDLRMPTRFAMEQVWYAYGDPARIRELLDKHVDAIGKKRNLGHGTVEEWIVEEIDSDRSVIDGDALQRRMPIECGIEGHTAMGAIRPPYHHRSRVVPCVEPAI